MMKIGYLSNFPDLHQICNPYCSCIVWGTRHGKI